jgi:hypothetical protein
MGLLELMRTLRKKGEKKSDTPGGGSTPAKPKPTGDEFTDDELEAMGYAYGKNAPGRQNEIAKMKQQREMARKMRAKQTN